MSGQQWRKTLWHLRHGGLGGLRNFKHRTRNESAHMHGRDEGALTSPEADRPDLSVIVPAYNVSDFIEGCLRSILQQAGVSLEVIVVDDGSTDDTAERVQKLSESYDRLILLRSDNSGPADARNRGVNRAVGVFIAFADADDEVLPGAYAAMVDSLRRTGSDIATGSYVRQGATGRSRPKLTARVHERSRLAVRLDDMPELLAEPVLWNKTYRREFWNRHVGEMNSFANYEDQEPVYRAFVSAAAIDVLTTDVYAWRLADGRDTRSKRKGRHTDLRARLRVIEALDTVLEHASEPVRDRAYAIWMGTDLAMHAAFLDTANKKFRETLTSAASRMKKAMPRRSWNLIPAQDRLFMWVIAAGRLDDIEEILGTRAEETTAVPLEFVEGRWMVALSFVPRLSTHIPTRLLRAHPVDFLPRFIIRNAQWCNEHEIELQGCAYVPGIDPADVKVNIRGVMDGAIAMDEPVERANDNRIDLEVGDPWRSYKTGGFRVRVNLSGVNDLSPRGIDISGHLMTHGLHLQTAATSTAVIGLIAPSPVIDGERVTVVANEHDQLSIRPVMMPPEPILAKNVTSRGEDITVTLTGDVEVERIDLQCSGHIIVMTAQGRSIFNASLPKLPERYATAGERVWSLSATTAHGRTAPVYYHSFDYLLPDTGRVRPAPHTEGAVKLSQRYRRVSITGASSDRDRLMLTGRIDPPEKLSVVLRSSNQTIVPVETSLHADGGFTAVYDLTAVGPEGGAVASMSGGYHVRYGTSPETAESWARVAGKLAIRPVDCFTEWNTFRAEGRSTGAVAITASPPWTSQERTKYGRFALRNRDWGPLTNGIVFESYNGKTTNDNPRALFDLIRAERDDIPLYWSIRDRRVDVPSGGIPVVEGTAEWHKALATSRVWINNNNFPYYVRKRLGQFYLQTWHGTPIKKLLWDIPRRKMPLTYRRLMRTEVPQWDMLLAQSEVAAKNLRSGLGFEGQIEIIEYPRNERLIATANNPKPVRERLGLSEDDALVLYVPTWREAHRSGKFLDWTEIIEPHRLSEATDSTILVRAHHVASNIAKLPPAPRVTDVSGEPHIEELMGIADILITDYSSAAIDFELTGKPLIYYMPDRLHYELERGFYNTEFFDDCSITNFDNLIETVQALKNRERPKRNVKFEGLRDMVRALLVKVTAESSIRVCESSESEKPVGGGQDNRELM